MSAVVGWHLLLKFHDKMRYEYPSYEMVPGSMFAGAVEGFLEAGGKELIIGTKEDLRGVSCADIQVVGVVPVGARDPDKKDYHISQRLMLRVRIMSLNKRMFFYISTLRARYGVKPINLKRDLYVAGSGQVLQICLSRAAVLKKHKAEIERLKDEKLEIALGIPQSKKRSQPQRQQHQPLVVEDDDEDVEGEDVEGEDVESEEGDEDNEDDQDLEGLVLSSLAKFKS
jgi:hypothetical protein